MLCSNEKQKTKTKTRKGDCYGFDFGNRYVGMLWLFMADKRHQGIPCKNRQGHEPAVYSADYHGLRCGDIRQGDFGADQLRADCIRDQFGNRVSKRCRLFSQRNLGQKARASYGGVNMSENEIRYYTKLNGLAEQNGIVIFGCGEDKNIPACELRQAFAVESKIYNRSFSHLSVCDAAAAYTQTVLPLAPETVLLHIGKDDMRLFSDDPSAFDACFRELIGLIRAENAECRIAVVSQRNEGNDPQTEEMNRHLQYIAESERCAYEDISVKRVWNPQASMDIVSFVYTMGFDRPLKNKRPLHDLVKIMFCFDA